MKSLLSAFIIMLYSTELLAGSACDIETFKKQYVDLQNALRYDGRNIELKKGKVRAVGDTSNDSENSPGKKAQDALYNNYRAALGKIKKIYDYLQSPDKLNSSEKELLANQEVTNFFKAIDKSAPNSKLNLNLDKLLNELKNKVKDKSFALTDNDIYLLKKLVVHSQDRVCTLENYIKSKKGAWDRQQYLEELKNKPLNLIISQLKNMNGTKDIEFSNEDLALDKAVEEGITTLHKLAQNCKDKLKNLNLGEPIQSCNYNKFIQSLSVNDSSFQSFEAILHFINANQKATDGRTSLEWIDLQLKNEMPVSCYVDPESKSLYVKNLPVKNEKVDASQFKCTTKNDKEASGETCLKGLSYEFVNGLGHKITTSKQANIKTITIKGSNCNNISLDSPKEIPPVESDEQKCTKNTQKEWKANKCVDKQVTPPQPEIGKTCSKDQCLKIQIEGKTISWNDEGKFCYTGSLGLSKEAALPSLLCSESAIEKVNPPTEETAESCKGKNKDFDKEKKVCIDKPAAPDETAVKKAECDKKIASDVDEETGRPLGNWTWNEKTKQCDKKPEKKQPSEDNSREDKTPADEKKAENPAPTPIPGKFVPVNIPQRQVFILPGMP